MKRCDGVIAACRKSLTGGSGTRTDSGTVAVTVDGQMNLPEEMERHQLELVSVLTDQSRVLPELAQTGSDTATVSTLMFRMD